jgi:hypothetical protein
MLESQNQEFSRRIEQVEAEVARLRALNEKISLSVGSSGSPSPARISVDKHSVSPQPEGSQLTTVIGQEPPQEDSGSSPSDGGYSPA